MVKITLKIDGTSCGMCEAHINDAVRAALSYKKSRLLPQKGNNGDSYRNTDFRSRIEIRH